jgi:hypothetical protein
MLRQPGDLIPWAFCAFRSSPDVGEQRRDIEARTVRVRIQPPKEKTWLSVL